MMLQGHGEKNVVKKIPSKMFFYYLEKFGTGEELDFRCLNFYLTLGKWFLRQNSRHVSVTMTRSCPCTLGRVTKLGGHTCRVTTLQSCQKHYVCHGHAL